MRLLDRDPGRSVDLAYVVARPLVSAFMRGYFDYEARNADLLPRHGSYVLAPNHLSHVDPVFSSLLTGRNVRYLAVDELFGRNRIFDALTGFWGTIPMPRGRVPWRALRTALATLRSERPVGIYPEARRVAYWGETPPSHGAAWLSLLSGAPIYPLAIEGSEHVLSSTNPRFSRSAVRATVLPPIEPLDYVDHESPLAAMTTAWQEAMIQVLGPPRTSD